MASVPIAPVVAAGLVGGCSIARLSGRRPLGGVVLAAAGAVCGRSWLRTRGPALTGVLVGTYLTTFGASHPLAKKLGAWPLVLTVTAAASATSYLLADRPKARSTSSPSPAA
ncbi:hypothetical protein MXD59_15170 [Frankia sp. Ag45/Mut15]|uniref:Integral membrane protein n=1 Tax=Frankia umida TaxID=573489 RepID=A0ABT0K1G1_9ACTN|nr:hypothetical protein [Frankia umida]MCK9877098.1 hypothetical protein [Frankia umida]